MPRTFDRMGRAIPLGVNAHGEARIQDLFLGLRSIRRKVTPKKGRASHHFDHQQEMRATINPAILDKLVEFFDRNGDGEIELVELTHAFRVATRLFLLEDVQDKPMAWDTDAADLAKLKKIQQDAEGGVATGGMGGGGGCGLGGGTGGRLGGGCGGGAMSVVRTLLNLRLALPMSHLAWPLLAWSHSLLQPPSSHSMSSALHRETTRTIPLERAS